MDFDHLLQHFDEEAVQREQVALIFYFLEEEKGHSEVTQSDVKDVIRRSRSSISESSVSTYFQRLQNDCITSTENDGYRLTIPGRRQVEELLDENALDNPRDEDDHFVDFDRFEEERYDQLISDINECYRYKIDDATVVLTRKLFEDLVFKILETHYAGNDPQMYFDLENQRHYRFDELLDNLKDGVPILKQYSPLFDKKVVEDIRELKEEGNKGAHVIRLEFTEEEMEELSQEATRLIKILYEIWWGVQQADKVEDLESE